MKYKFGFKQFLKPTPKLVARIGYSLAAAGTTATTIAAITDHPKLALVMGILTVVGTFISKLFGESDGN